MESILPPETPNKYDELIFELVCKDKEGNILGTKKFIPLNISGLNINDIQNFAQLNIRKELAFTMYQLITEELDVDSIESMMPELVDRGD